MTDLTRLETVQASEYRGWVKRGSHGWEVTVEEEAQKQSGG